MSQKLDSCSKQPSLPILLISKFNMCSVQRYESLCYFLEQLRFNHHFTKQQSNRMFCIPPQCLWKWAWHRGKHCQWAFPCDSGWQLLWNETLSRAALTKGAEWKFEKINSSQSPNFPLCICQMDKSLPGVRRKSGLPHPCVAAAESSGTWRIRFCSSTWSWPPLEMSTAILTNLSCTENCIHIGHFIIAIKGRKRSRRIIWAKGNIFQWGKPNIPYNH